MATRKTTKKKTPVKANKSILPEVIAIIIVALSLFVAASMYTNGTGAVGLGIKNIFLGIFGLTAYLVPLLILVLGSNLIIEKRIVKYRSKYIVISIILIIVSAMCEFFSGLPMEGNFAQITATAYYDGIAGFGGGVIGGWINTGLERLTGSVGTMLLYVAGLLICITILFQISVTELAKNMVKGIQTWMANRPKPEPSKQPQLEEDKPVIITNQPVDMEEEDEYDEIIVPEEEDVIIGPDSPILPETDDTVFADRIIDENNQVALDVEQGIEEFVPEYSSEIIENYIFPKIDLLKLNKKSGKAVKEQDLMNNARKLIDTLSSFGVQAKILQVSKGPAITRYELQPMAGVKVSKIVNLADDIALNLAAQGVRIEAPIPGKAAIGIEVPNTDVDMVTMREVLDTDEFKNHPSKLAVALGKDISGSPIIIDLAKMPHLLIAGATGSGKSVCINSIITSIMYKASPNEVKLLLIDPKVVELSAYNGIPHLDTPVVTKAKKAAGALSWAVTEMMKRYDMFSEAKVRDIKGYNAAAAEMGYPPMPQIVIIIDELADLMMVAPNEVEDSICRIAQLARAAGMHLVIATQRPSVNVITGIIKANIPSRIAFAVSSQIDSRTILDMAGAEKLLGRGDMLYHPGGASKPKRIQGAFISDSEVEKIVNFVKQNGSANYDPNIIEHIESEQLTDREKTESSGDNDELLPKAIDIVMEMGQASTSMIQRKLSVGYARAGRIVDQMEARGLIGPSEGSKGRPILITKEQYLEMKSSGMFEEPMKY